jgi:hypothetical protein
MGFHRLLRDLKGIADTHGPAAAIHDFAMRAANHVADVQVLKGMTAHLRDVTDPDLFEADGYEGRFATMDELMPYAETGEHEFSIAFVRRAFARGDRCYALFHQGTLASHGWYSNRPTAIDPYFDLHFDPAYTYMYKGYTAPAYRGQRLHAVGMCRALRTVTEEGKRGLISYVFSNNFASLRSVHRMGYRIFGTVIAVRAGSSALVHATRGCKAYDFRLVRRTDEIVVPPEVIKAR